MTTENNTVTAVISSGIGSTAVIFFRDAVTAMIPWLILSVPLIVLDLDYGIKAARHRGDKIRFSKAFRKTFGKAVEYVAWCCLAATAARAFEAKWLEWLVMGAVNMNEMASIIGNYAETKDVTISWSYIWNKLLRIVGAKAGIDTGDIDVGEVVKPKPNRDPSTGKFTKK